MQKAHQNINWENYPSIKTPLNEQNLNKLDHAVDVIDDRVVELYGYEERAKQSEINAKASEDASFVSETNAEAYATESESYAHGGTNSRQSEDVDNAKYYKEQTEALKREAQSLVDALGNIYIYQTSVTWAEFNQIDTSTIKAGYTWNITEPFTTDDRFIDGAGIDYGKGTNVTWGDEGKWDCNDGISAGTGIIKISYEEFKAHEADYRATGKTYWVSDKEDDPFSYLKKNFPFTDNVSVESKPTPRDADLLNGQKPEYYAKKSELDTLNGNLAQLRTSKTFSGTLNLTLEPNSRYLISDTTTTTTYYGLWLVATYDTGLIIYEISKGSNVTASSDGLIFILTNASSRTSRVDALKLNN